MSMLKYVNYLNCAPHQVIFCQLCMSKVGDIRDSKRPMPRTEVQFILLDNMVNVEVKGPLLNFVLKGCQFETQETYCVRCQTCIGLMFVRAINNLMTYLEGMYSIWNDRITMANGAVQII